ncbi:protein of unknown function [Methylorubrum extorquens]|uniref:Uncharacterized protein n=2 Tax=Methylorubrum extorquens TaxID=408 RepID=C7CGM8_METED|nr:hypothetical protein B2G69_12195 [Methylorubrum zatmanii]CAX23128.1 protein of unknown function [Methylorubrum extorquens DM4]SOR31705.1 protein of unknown function [Methylorubrum extorquens]
MSRLRSWTRPSAETIVSLCRRGELIAPPAEVPSDSSASKHAGTADPMDPVQVKRRGVLRGGWRSTSA